jgi:hypothetical protein
VSDEQVLNLGSSQRGRRHDHNQSRLRIERIPNLGGKLAAPAEVAVMVLVEGQVSFVDIRNNARSGQGC